MQRESKSPLRAKRFACRSRTSESFQLKSGKKLDLGRGCVRVKSLEDLALDTRGSASGSGTRQGTRMSHAKREVGAACALLVVQRRSRDNRPFGCTARSRMERSEACDIDVSSRAADL